MAHRSLGVEENLSHPLIDSEHIGHQQTDSWNTPLVTEDDKQEKKNPHVIPIHKCCSGNDSLKMFPCLYENFGPLKSSPLQD